MKKYHKALIISRYHDDLANPIYNAYIRGIESQCSFIHFVDYFDQINMLGQKGFEEQIKTTLKKENIDLIFFIFVSGDPSINPYFIQEIAKNRFIAMVFWDTEQFFEQIDRYYAQLADLVILPANYEYIHRLNALGINAICPFSLFDNSKYVLTNASANKTIDVSFVGEVTKGKRKEYIEYLLANGIKIETFGVGTKNGKVSFEKVVEIFNRSKINLSFTGTYDSSVYTYCSNINNRIKQNKGKPIEISMCGGFVLSEYVPGIEKVFHKNDIDTFLTKEELLEKIKYYLQHSNEREKMAQRAYQHSLENYDSIPAFAKIFQTIQSINIKPQKKLTLDDIFIKTHNTFNFYYLITYLLKSQFSYAFEILKQIIYFKYFIVKDLFIFIKYALIQFKDKMKFKLAAKKLFSSIGSRDVVIYGAGVHTHNLIELLPQIKKLNIKAIADQNQDLHSKYKYGYKVIAIDEIDKYAHDVIISSARFEKEIYESLQSQYQGEINIYKLYDGLRDDILNRYDPYQMYRNTLKLK